jgi:hypothetical protein
MKSNASQPAFDIINTAITVVREKHWVELSMQVIGKAGC